MKKLILILFVISSFCATAQTNWTNIVGAEQSKDTVGGKLIRTRFANGYIQPIATPLMIKDSLKNYQQTFNFVTPEDFGAVGDGVTDDKVALQNAVNSGKPIQLQKKRYFISGSIELIEGTFIVGTGTGTVTNIYITANEPAFLIKGDNINIERVSFIGDYSFVSNSYSTAKPNQHAIALIGTSDFTTQYDRILISNCTFYNMSGAGFYSTYNVGDNGIFAGGAQLTNNLAFGCAFGYFNDVRGEYNSFVNNKAYYCAIGYRNSGGNNNFTGGILNSNNTGAYLEGGANNAHGYIDATSLNHNFEYGVWSNGITLGHTISNSPIYANDIYVQSSIGVKFFNCDISANNIYVQSSTLTEFKENKFTTTPTLYLAWNGTNNTGTLNNVNFFNNFFWGSTPSNIQNDVLNNNLDLNGQLNIYGTQLNFYANSSEIVNRNAPSIDIYSSGSTLAGKIYSNGNWNLGYNTDQTYKLGVNGTGFFNSSLTANSFIKSGGTSSQFLKADGSVDATSYAPIASPTLTGTLTTPNVNVTTSTLATSNYRLVTRDQTSGQLREVDLGTINGALIYEGSGKTISVAPASDRTTATVDTKTANYTVVLSDVGSNGIGVIRANATSGNITITLPAASTTTGLEFIVKKIDATANTVTVSVASTIDGTTTKVFNTQYSGLRVISNGTNYDITGTF